MARETIKIKITKDGNATITTENFVGKACVTATEELEARLGKVVNREHTAEYYKPEPPKEVWVIE
jgi:hypothetical protein